jgi:hypothetical protein
MKFSGDMLDQLRKIIASSITNRSVSFIGALRAINQFDPTSKQQSKCN